jgi:mRNA interferase MazF
MPSTTVYQPGDLILVTFPHTSGGKAASRPALVLLDTGDADVLLARVTTQRHTSPYDLSIADWHGAGLLAASFIRLHKLASIEKSLVRRLLGILQPADRARVSTLLKQMFGNW